MSEPLLNSTLPKSKGMPPKAGSLEIMELIEQQWGRKSTHAILAEARVYRPELTMPQLRAYSARLVRMGRLRPARRTPTDVSPEELTKIEAMAGTHKVSDIAYELRISESAIRRIAALHDINLRRRSPDAD
jgi:DNA-binding NarL/FixJ family response regulator